MAEALRIGIVGCGGIARAHVGGYDTAGGNTIVSTFDTVAPSAEKLAADTGARAAASMEEMIERDGVQAVSVCTPPSAHEQSCAPFLEAGIPVLCEKPLGVDVAAAERLAALAQRTGTVFMVAFCHRFHPPVIALRKLIDDGVLGRPLLLRNVFGGYGDMTGNHRTDPAVSGGGPLIDHCSHSVDLYRHLVGDAIAVQAMAGNVMQDLPIEDFGMMQLASEGPSFGEIAGSYSLPGAENWVEFFGTKGMAKISYWNAGQPDLAYRTSGGEWTPVDVAGQPDRFAAEVAHFMECARTGTTPRITAADGVAANRIVEGAYRSVREGARVALP